MQKIKNGRFYPSAVNVLNLIADAAKKVKSVGDLKSPNTMQIYKLFVGHILL